MRAIGAPLFHSKNLAFALIDLNLKFKYINKKYSKIIGYSKEELEGVSVRIVLGNNLFLKALAELPYYLRTKEVRIPEWEIRTKEGHLLKGKIDFSTVKIDGTSYLLIIPIEVTETKELEKKLEFEKLRLESIAESAQFGFWDVNFNTQEYITNDMWWKMLGYEPHFEKRVDLFFDSILHPDDRVLLLKETERIQEGDKSILDFTFRIKAANGTWRWVQTHGKAIDFNEDGSIARLVGVHIDVTEHKQRDEILEQKELHFKTFTERTPHIIWSSGKNGTPFFLNKAGLDFFGISEADLETWMWSDVTTEKEYPFLLEKWTACVKKNIAFEYTHQLKRKDGKFVWFQVTHFPHTLDENGNITWTSVATNINERVKGETKLEVANSRFRSLIDAAPIPIYSLSVDGFVNDLWNPAAERILGWKKEEVVGKLTPLATEDYMEQFHENLELIKSKGQLKKITTRQIKDGSKIIIEVNSGCIYDEDGNIEEILILLLDITKQEQQTLSLQESVKEKETLLQEIHHRVKNNLAIVASLLQLQIFTSSNENEKLRLTEAQNRVLSIGMVHELLYRSEDFNKVNLQNYYDKLINSIKGNMISDDVKVDHSLDINIETLNINQAIPLGLLINELLTNSLKYAFKRSNHQNRISLRVDREEERISVIYTDNGIGFNMDGRNFRTGLGFQIIESLLEQLDADYVFDTKNKFELKLEFSEKQKGAHSNLI